MNTPDTPAASAAPDKPWHAQTICCGRDDGTYDFATRGDAELFRSQYTAGAGVAGPGLPGGHNRSVIITGPADQSEREAGTVLAEYLEAMRADKGMRGMVEECIALCVEVRANLTAEVLRADRAENARDQLGEMLHTAQEQRNQAHALRVLPRSLEPLIDKERHSPARVRSWLATHGWTLFQQYDECSEWTTNAKRPGWPGEGGIVVVLDSTRFSGYAHHLAAVVTDLAGLHGIGELGVLAGIEAQAVQDAPQCDAQPSGVGFAATEPTETPAEPQRPAESIDLSGEIDDLNPAQIAELKRASAIAPEDEGISSADVLAQQAADQRAYCPDCGHPETNCACG